MFQRLDWIAIILLLSTQIANAQEGSSMSNFKEEDRPYLLNYQDLEDPFGRVVLSNDKLLLQRLVVPGGRWEGIHGHPGNQLYVHIKGGYWSGQLAGEYEYRHELSADGEVGWMDYIPYEDGHNSGNTGDSWIDLIYVTLKSDTPINPDGDHKAQSFPSITMDVVFENDRIIAQRGELAPGAWTGRHNRPGNQLYITISGGHLVERQNGELTAPVTELEDGTPKWLEAGDGYELGNMGDTPVDLVLLTIK